MDSAAAALSPQAAAAKIAAVRVPFIENKGQIAGKEVQFYAKTFAGTLFVTQESALVYSLPQKSQKNPRASWVFRESFAGRQPTHPHGEIKSPVRVSSYKGNDPRAWQRQLAAFDNIGLGELYPGIRLSLKAADNNVEKLFYIAPGASPDAIKIEVSGVLSLAVDDHGQLVLATTLGDIILTAPVAYQMVNGRRRASNDPDGQIVHYHWTQSAGSAVSIRNADSDLADFTAPRVRRGAAQTLVFQLEVTDNRDATAVDQATIRVTR